MPTTGSPWYIPYVAGTDLVADWPTDSQELAEAVADGLDAAQIVRQVVSDTKDDTYAVSLAAGGVDTVNVTGLEAVITPGDTYNQVLVIASVNLALSSTSAGPGFVLYRDSTAIAVGASAGSRTPITAMAYHGTAQSMGVATMMFLDTPNTTSATTYGVRLFNSLSASATVRVNRTQTDTDSAQYGRALSTITAIEISA